jgi:hypothetical protein
MGKNYHIQRSGDKSDVERQPEEVKIIHILNLVLLVPSPSPSIFLASNPIPLHSNVAFISYCELITIVHQVPLNTKLLPH